VKIEQMRIKAIPTEYKGIKFRSKLEATYARLFDKQNLSWEYEPKSFDFGEIGYGTGRHLIYYTPDFLIENKFYFEVKGSSENFSSNSKERVFALYLWPKKLYIGESYWPEKEPRVIKYLHKPFQKHDGYSTYISDEGYRKLPFSKFLEIIRGDNNE